MARPYDPPSHIPPFVKPIIPYIRTRQEALRIRQVLTLYLRSFIVFRDETDQPCHAQSHLSLCAPADNVVDVKRIPADFPGLRKEFLEALKTNFAARKEFHAVSDDVAALRRQLMSKNRPSEPVDPQDLSGDMRDYLQLLRDRRRHTKLRVFQHYLEELKAKEAGEPELMGMGESSDQQLLLSEDLHTNNPDRQRSDTDLEGLVHRLERAVVRARAQLDREKQLFEKAKAQHNSRTNELPSEAAAAAKARALQRTRDELVQWVEERLVPEGDPEESMIQDLSAEEIEETQRVLEHQKTEITEQYNAYLHARRDLLDAASRACQPVTATSKPPSRPNYKTDNVPEEGPPPNSLDVLSYANEVLVPLSKTHKALALQRSYLSGLLTKEKTTALRALHRLSDESHLLPEYPILSRQPRFKHAVAALSSRNLSSTSDQNPPDEVVSLAEAWAFASNAAGTNEREYVQQKVVLGTEVAQDARKTLEEVYNTLNQDLEDVLQENTPHEADPLDIWASEARSRRAAGNHAGGSRLERRPKGPWSGLNGRVGTE
ncbi:hypothetical protein N7462_011393 [Penicillium macrosclerotiorum]|uniref:uncharacterized protein n=1 Tax=Penicillium macrosclerotiorum TaxID=303699 RepID=UPI002548A162|nr:uncharacterized protein N7462_011393 [Penicillium macrosclerotiorum]KAJ5666984.1 hypothetical protein N7462_011393 [Penicillium macrosclerotiorum]